MLNSDQEDYLPASAAQLVAPLARRWLILPFNNFTSGQGLREDVEKVNFMTFLNLRQRHSKSLHLSQNLELQIVAVFDIHCAARNAST